MREFKPPTGALRYLVGEGRGDETEVDVSCNKTSSRLPRSPAYQLSIVLFLNVYFTL